jgi:hypothetical protein
MLISLIKRILLKQLNVSHSISLIRVIRISPTGFGQDFHIIAKAKVQKKRGIPTFFFGCYHFTICYSSGCPQNSTVAAQVGLAVEF